MKPRVVKVCTKDAEGNVHCADMVVDDGEPDGGN
jgi:hypothetical protein